MWIAVTVFNPTIALLALALVPIGRRRRAPGSAAGPHGADDRRRLVCDGHLGGCGAGAERRGAHQLRRRERPRAPHEPRPVPAAVPAEDEPPRHDPPDHHRIPAAGVSVLFITGGSTSRRWPASTRCRFSRSWCCSAWATCCSRSTAPSCRARNGRPGPRTLLAIAAVAVGLCGQRRHEPAVRDGVSSSTSCRPS